MADLFKEPLILLSKLKKVEIDGLHLQIAELKKKHAVEVAALSHEIRDLKQKLSEIHEEIRNSPVASET